MIKNLIILLFLWSPLAGSFQTVFPKNVEKRIEKSLHKYFEKAPFSKHKILVHDSILDQSNSSFYQVKGSEEVVYMVITIANGCRLGGCDLEHGKKEEFEQFFIYSLFNQQAELIEVRILDYPSEHGYEINSRWWLKQFVKKKSDERYSYAKNIDGISGATTSIKSMIKEMNFLKKTMPSVISATEN